MSTTIEAPQVLAWPVGLYPPVRRERIRLPQRRPEPAWTSGDFHQGPYVVLFRAQGWLGRAIRWHTRSDWNHVGIVLSGWLFEARYRRGVQVRKWGVQDRYPDIAWRVRAPKVPFEAHQRREMRTWLRRQVGCPYDTRNVLRFLTRRRQVASNTEGQWFCSELAAAAFDHVGRSLWAATQPWEVSPDDFARTRALTTVMDYQAPGHR